MSIKSNQSEWVFDDKHWQKKLKFDKDGYILNEYSENILAGKWTPSIHNL